MKRELEVTKRACCIDGETRSCGCPTREQFSGQETNVRYTRLTSETIASVRLATYTHSGIPSFNWRPLNTQASTQYKISEQLVYRSIGVQI